MIALGENREARRRYTDILDGAALVLSTLFRLTWTASTSSGVAFIFKSLLIM